MQKASGSRLEQFLCAALKGEDVYKESRRRNWGLEVPWRVTTIKGPSAKRGATSTSKANQELSKILQEQDDGVEGESKKKSKLKPNKKRRIVLRERVKKVEAEREKRKREELLKEENEREKRTRKNREKKVKRKAKLKAGTAAGTAGNVDVSVVGGEGGEKMDVD